ncbi:PIG-L family deacetylase [Streptomyces scopuliridis]|uniref:PIG-L family deacetylase n=1 Tax=Streptomyces scopuliridis TaxID=452529 RepID=UPI0036C41491
MRTPLRAGIAILVALCGVSPGAAARESGAPCRGSTVAVVAHQDDDLLFLNPDLMDDFKHGRCLRVVYVTAGDAGKPMEYTLSRERGMRAAYAALADAAPRWRRADTWADGRRFLGYELAVPHRPRVHLTFLRLPDGHSHGTGDRARHWQSLRKLAEGEIPRMVSVDGVNSLTSEELTHTLGTLIAESGADTVRTLDPGSVMARFHATGRDHSDHTEVGRYVTSAVSALRAGEIERLVHYLGYPSASLLANLNVGVTASKQRLFDAYLSGKRCRVPCPATPQHFPRFYLPWLARQYHD